MPFEDTKSHLQDIFESIALIEQFVNGIDLEAYRRDSKTQAARTQAADHQRSSYSTEGCSRPPLSWGALA